MAPPEKRPSRIAAELTRAVLSERELEEIMTDLWFNHFNVDARKGAVKWMVADYERTAIRTHALGKFRDLLLATAHHPAMLFYLDNWMSTKADRVEPFEPNKGPERALNENCAAVKMLKTANPARFALENGAQYPRGKLGEDLKQIAQLSKADVGLEACRQVRFEARCRHLVSEDREVRPPRREEPAADGLQGAMLTGSRCSRGAPRTVKSPTTSIQRGRATATKSFWIRLVTSSWKAPSFRYDHM